MLASLRAAEDALDSRAAALLAALREEVGEYQGYRPEELDALVAGSAGEAVAARRAAALEVLAAAEAFLDEQAAGWAAVSVALSAWLNRLCAMFDEHRKLTGADESGEDWGGGGCRRGGRVGWLRFGGEGRAGRLAAVWWGQSFPCPIQTLGGRLEWRCDVDAGGAAQYCTAPQ